MSDSKVVLFLTAAAIIEAANLPGELACILLCSFPMFVAALDAHKTENTRNTAAQPVRSNARAYDANRICRRKPTRAAF